MDPSTPGIFHLFSNVGLLSVHWYHPSSSICCCCATAVVVVGGGSSGGGGGAASSVNHYTPLNKVVSMCSKTGQCHRAVLDTVGLVAEVILRQVYTNYDVLFENKQIG